MQRAARAPDQRPGGGERASRGPPCLATRCVGGALLLLRAAGAQTHCVRCVSGCQTVAIWPVCVVDGRSKHDKAMRMRASTARALCGVVGARSM